ncbi:MAG: complement inhibitor SCIN family protein, partial [Proteobacteria bacterium]|nr:complement inhibitor SCIN family protein [Pseudomonadota bacterium]
MKIKSWIFCGIAALVWAMPGVARAADSNTSTSSTTNTSTQGSTNKPTPDQTLTDLKKNAAAMKATEQSTENKLLGGAAIGASGIGGMQLM